MQCYYKGYVEYHSHRKSAWICQLKHLVNWYNVWCSVMIIITCDNKVIMFPTGMCVCVFMCLSRWISGRYSKEELVPHKWYFAGIAVRVCTHGAMDDITGSKSRSTFAIAITFFIVQFPSYSVEYVTHRADCWHWRFGFGLKIISGRKSKQFREFVKSMLCTR